MQVVANPTPTQFILSDPAAPSSSSSLFAPCLLAGVSFSEPMAAPMFSGLGPRRISSGDGVGWLATTVGLAKKGKSLWSWPETPSTGGDVLEASFSVVDDGSWGWACGSCSWSRALRSRLDDCLSIVPACVDEIKKATQRARRSWKPNRDMLGVSLGYLLGIFPGVFRWRF
jgi:hypothetical protein